MTTARKALARRALRAALDTRRSTGEAKTDPICIYDVAERLGIEVRFCGGNSFGGLYAKTSQIILVPSLRPAGRQVYTCAHELGHWFFGHGSRVDELPDPTSKGDPEEQLVDLYAGYLLMPPWAVEHALEARGWQPDGLTPLNAYTLSSQFGVGYETLIQHMSWSLSTLAESRASMLLKTSPKQLRLELLGDGRPRHLVVVDKAWRKVAADLQVGDVALIEANVTIEGRSARVAGRCGVGTLVEAIAPGISLAQSREAEWAVSVRVRRKDFEGRSIYRHLEDPDVNECA